MDKSINEGNQEENIPSKSKIFEDNKNNVTNEKLLQNHSSNNDLLRTFEERIIVLESSIGGIKQNLEKKKSERNSKTENVQNVYKEAKNMFEELNNKLEEKIKSNFEKSFDSVTKKLMVLEKTNEELKKQNSELTGKLFSTENNLKSALKENSEMERNYNELRSELDLIKSNYDEVVHQNKIMNEEIYGKNAKIESMSMELQNLRNLLIKLSDVKNILNQHLSSNNNHNAYSSNDNKLMNDGHNTINFEKNSQTQNSNKDFDPLINKLNSLYGKSNKIIPSSIGTLESPKNQKNRLFNDRNKRGSIELNKAEKNLLNDEFWYQDKDKNSSK